MDALSPGGSGRLFPPNKTARWTRPSQGLVAETPLYESPVDVLDGRFDRAGLEQISIDARAFLPESKALQGNGSRVAVLPDDGLQLMESAAKKWRLLNSSQILPDIIQGIKCIDGIGNKFNSYGLDVPLLRRSSERFRGW